MSFRKKLKIVSSYDKNINSTLKTSTSTFNLIYLMKAKIATPHSTKTPISTETPNSNKLHW